MISAVAHAAEGLRVVVLTSTGLGCRAAAALMGLPGVRDLTLLTAPAVRRRRSLLEKAVEAWRFDGPYGVARATAQRLRRPRLRATAELLAGHAATHCPGVRHIHLPDFRAADAPDALRALAPDLGVVVATHRLDPPLYGVPRLGSINLHLGHAPEYRGSSPAFWELYDGTPEVGVTIHWVNERLDAGDILRQERAPIDVAPAGDPLAYLERYRATILLPRGFQVLAETVNALCRGPVPAQRQDLANSRTRKRATWRDKEELRRRVAARRLEASDR
jgi:methionyl-tRNA formyltransferase